MAYIVMAYIAMAFLVMAYIVMAYIVMAFRDMAYIADVCTHVYSHASDLHAKTLYQV